jgi:hypothetical protein
VNALSKSFGSSEAPTSFTIAVKRAWRWASVSLGFRSVLRAMVDPLAIIAPVLSLDSIWRQPVAPSFQSRKALTNFARNIAVPLLCLALQLHFRFEMGAACFRLVSSSPE